ncbi:DUF1841 family protein [Acidihalobacter prosperus]
MFGNDRTQIRLYYQKTWQRHLNGELLDPLETRIAQVIEIHPEYHTLISRGGDVLERDFDPDEGQSNPFLHLGLHIAIREQVATDRPPGIADVHQRLCLRCGEAHEAEHQLMECLGTTLWEAQRAGNPPDEKAYLACARRLL